MKTAKNAEYDERQLQIRGDVFKHGFFAAICLLLLNGFLNDYGIVWADGFHQNLIIAMLLSTVIGVESQLRGAYFAKNTPAGLIIGLFAVLSVVMGVLTLTHVAEGEPFIKDGALTDVGENSVIFALFALNTIVGTIQYIRNKKQEKEKNDVIDG